MNCPNCLRESRTPDACEWCHQLLPLQNASGVQPTMSMPPLNSNIRRRVSLSGDVVEDEVEPTLAMYAQPGQTPTQTMSPYPGQAQTQAMNPMRPQQLQTGALPPGAYSAAVMQHQMREEESTLGERWEKCLAFCLPLVVLSILIIHFIPGAFYWVAALNLFVIPVIMSGLRAIPPYEEAILDCTIMLVVTFLVGPLIGLVVYAIVCAIKQEANSAILAILVLNLLVKYLFAFAFSTTLDLGSMLTFGVLLSFMSFGGVLLSFVGWLMGGFFRPISDLPSV